MLYLFPCRQPGRDLGGRESGTTMLEHQGVRWGFVFLQGASHVPNDEIEDLMKRTDLPAQMKSMGTLWDEWVAGTRGRR